MRLRVDRVELRAAPCSARTPFRFGVVSVARATCVVARVGVELEDGRRGLGHAADLCVPRWFRKDVQRSPEEDVRALLSSAAAARSAWLAQGANEASLFAHWHAVYAERVDALPFEHPERLERGFGVSLIERAAMDACCRAAETSFHAALREDLFALELGRLHPDLRGWSAARSLPAEPAASVELRHTVGLLDPLRADELEASARVGDGEPEALDEYVRAHGLSCFKLKLGGEPEVDRARLCAVGEVLAGASDARPRLSLDANEQYADLGSLARMLDAVDAHVDGRRLLEGLLWIEQPLPRERCFEAGGLAGLDALTQRAPLLLDEADTGLGAFPRARELGWEGVSVKNCKGVFRALANRAWCERLGGFQSAEDLTNLPAVALQQDLATVAAFGFPHVERNGHHYFRGLEHLPGPERERALERAPALYEPAPGGARLRVRRGLLALSDVNGVGYGGADCVAFEEREPVDAATTP